MTPHDFGRATEARFCMDAQTRGLLVNRPFDSAPGYDAVVDNGGRLFRVQIKGARLTYPGRGRAARYTFTFGRAGKFDVFAAWLEEEQTWLFMPSSRCRGSNVAIGSGSPYRTGLGAWEIFGR